MRLRVWMCASALAATPALFAQARLTLADAVSEALAGNLRASPVITVLIFEGRRQLCFRSSDRRDRRKAAKGAWNSQPRVFTAANWSSNYSGNRSPVA